MTLNRVVCSRISSFHRISYCEDYSWKLEVFSDRLEAGRLLAGFIEQVLGRIKGVVVALASGGVPVAYMVAEILDLPLDVVVVKKVTFPWTTEAGFGAVALDGSIDYEKEALPTSGYTKREFEVKIAEIKEYVRNKTLRLRGRLDYDNIRSQHVLLVDDGIATGYTARVACDFLSKQGATRVTLASPTASLEGAVRASEMASEVLVLNLRAGLYYAVADAYREWHDVSDDEALEYIRRYSMKKQES